MFSLFTPFSRKRGMVPASLRGPRNPKWSSGGVHARQVVDAPGPRSSPGWLFGIVFLDLTALIVAVGVEVEYCHGAVYGCTYAVEDPVGGGPGVAPAGEGDGPGTHDALHGRCHVFEGGLKIIAHGHVSAVHEAQVVEDVHVALWEVPAVLDGVGSEGLRREVRPEVTRARGPHPRVRHGSLPGDAEERHVGAREVVYRHLGCPEEGRHAAVVAG